MSKLASINMKYAFLKTQKGVSTHAHMQEVAMLHIKVGDKEFERERSKAA